ncbi:endopeptidase La [Candidatus Calescamantes bacterium]|nr:endopeptidase La [Candidatus Calescamantes bacterium]
MTRVLHTPRTSIFYMVPLRDIVIFPHMIVPLLVGRPKSIRAVAEAMKSGRKIFLLTQKEAAKENPTIEDLYTVGTIANILQVIKLPDNTIKLLVEGAKRGKVERFLKTDEYFQVEVLVWEEKTPFITRELEALTRAVKDQFERYVKLNPKMPDEFINTVQQIEDPRRLADVIASHILVKVETKQKILEAFNIKERLQRLSEILNGEIEILELEKRIQDRVREQIGKTQKEFYLQEQMKAIQKELGREEDPEIAAFREKINTCGMPEEVKKKALNELERLTKMMPFSPEATVVRNYLDWLTSMPWKEATRDKLDLKRAHRILDEDHYGLEKVKERVLEFLAVRKNARSTKGPILCFVGPPGVGKTSVAKSIARALGRKFVRVSLGGVRDEAEIRGHRRTYVGALPGKIIQGMRRAGTKNPVFLLDEVDKMSVDFRGDPSAALLEVLDPEQNHAFNDHYLDVDFDLSQVMFITTANTTYTIPPPLLDRMEVIEFSGYTEEEKVKIAEKFLIPKQLKAHGFKKGEVTFSEAAIRKIIREYTREAGVRNLEREIASVLRKLAREKVEKKRKKKFRVTEKMLEKFLGPPRFRYLFPEAKKEVGVVMGLAWTEAGGEILAVEATVMKGKGNLILTGKLGEVMKESAQAALSFIRSRSRQLGINEEIYEKVDIHVHVPEGAIPKDGPSAGVAMLTAMASALTQIPVDNQLAMTGEITLRGKVLPVGGIKTKILAAHRGGIKKVIIPKDNEKDLVEIPPYVKKELEIIGAETVDEVLKIALGKDWTLSELSLAVAES